MEQLIDRVSSAAATEPETARKAIATILNFLQKNGDPDAVGQLLDKIPGAREAAAGAAAEDGGGGGGFLGGLIGGGGLMGLANQLSGLGLSMDQMQTTGRELFSFAREHAGEDAVGSVAASVPGLQQFV